MQLECNPLGSAVLWVCGRNDEIDPRQRTLPEPLLGHGVKLDWKFRGHHPQGGHQLIAARLQIATPDRCAGRMANGDRSPTLDLDPTARTCAIIRLGTVVAPATA